MTAKKIHTIKSLKEVSKAPSSNGEAVAELYKALKASYFYPEKHPLRYDILQRAYHLLAKLMGGKGLSLVITRNGFSAAEGGLTVPDSLMAKALAKELFLREVRRLTFLPPLSFQDLQNFLSILSVDPQKIVAAGGMEKILAEQDIRNVVANDIDISTVFTKRHDADAERGKSFPEIMETESIPPLMNLLPPDEIPEMEIDEIISTMETERKDSRYLLLADLLLQKAQPLKERNQFEPLVPIVLSLLNQSLDSMRSPTQRDSAHAAFEQIADEEMIQFFLSKLEERRFEKKETVCLILHYLGEKAAPAVIQRINFAENIHSRKALETALVRIGRAAIPSLLVMLHDSRWYVVRSMLSILGEIGGNDFVQELKLTVYHDDSRVKREAVRCLTKIGGPEAAGILIHLLADKDPSLVKRVIFSLGILKCDKALEPLIEILNKRDIFLKSVALKKEALQAIGLLGDKRAVPHLIKIAKKRYLLAGKHGVELRILAIETIGLLGNASSLDFLRKVGSRGGDIGKASKVAVDLIMQKTGVFS